MRDLKEEFLKVIYLNKANVIIAFEELSKGTLDQAHVYPREVLKRAIEMGASGIILVHNHPSGTLKPSSQDIQITRKISAACLSLDIEVLDHIIISSYGHISLKAKGLFV
ncbi:MAG: hypothetical protein GY870_10160 [archaeon]|nr:hypothetical protein [archaeon]